MTTSGHIETLCRPFYERAPHGTAAQPSGHTAAPSEFYFSDAAAQLKESRRARAEHRARLGELQRSRAPPAIRTGMYEADSAEADWDPAGESTWYGEFEQPESEDATGVRSPCRRPHHIATVEEHLLAIYPAADVAVIKDIAACAVASEWGSLRQAPAVVGRTWNVSSTAGTFAAVAWGCEKLAEMLAPAPAVAAPPVVPQDVPEWELLDAATPRSLASDASWADCGVPALQRTYAAVAAVHETTQMRAGAPAWSIPPLAHARRPRTKVLRECPTISEAEALKEDRVCTGEQRRFALSKEKRASVPRARRLERKSCVAAC